jgi:hypothetical protein
MTDNAAVTVADDDILNNRIIPGLVTLREHLDCSLQEALYAFTARYEELRTDRPGDFVCGPDEYWAGFFS